MKDIDFDELDKAVNSLMATTPESTEKPATDVKPETVLDISAQPTASEVSAPAVTGAAESVAVTTTAAPTPAPAPSALATPVAPAVKRTGRFMDMVHTSSDMKPRPATLPPSREGLSITPRSESIVSEVPTSAAPEATTPSAPTPSLNDTIPVTMPDPIDMGTPAEPATEETTPSEKPVSPAPAATAESPFIADAKVEKRPLNPGSMGSDSFDTQLANELNADDSSEPTDKTDADQTADEPPATPQIPELSSDLVAIESNDKLEEPVATQATDTKEAAKDVAAPAAPLGATSIAKQYKSQPSTGDQSHAAIYDASQYPEPVAHPAKKKSGWLWVLWVVLLLGLGAGVAVLLYFLGIIP